MILLAACVATGCSQDTGTTQGTDTPPAAAAAGEARDTFTFGITQYPSTLHPLIENMSAKTIVLGMTTRPLTTIDHDWQDACRLCTELPTLENGRAELVELEDGSEGMRIRWTLRPELFWGDGEPVTTEDFRFAWEMARHPQSGAIGMEFWRSIRDLEIVDARTMVMVVDRRPFGYNAAWIFWPLPEHLERAVFEAAPGEYMNRTLYQTDPTNPGLWLGPYRVTETARGSHVTLARNEAWRGPEPAFERIVVRTLERTTTLEANLLSGNLDAIWGELGMSLDQALAFEQRHGDDYQILFEPGLLYEHIDLNLDNPILADVRVRRALLHAADRNQLVQQLFDGRQQVAATFVHPMDAPFTMDGVATYEHDPEAAAALLDEAGWTLGPDGIRRNADGEPLQLELMTTAGNKMRELVQQVLQSQWRAAGIDVRLRNEAPRIFFGETTRKRAFDSMAMFAWVSAPEPVPRTVLHSSEIPTEANNHAGQNYTGYRNPEVDELIVAIENELDTEARMALWARLQAIYARDLPVLPLYFRTNVHILPEWIEGVRPTGHIITATQWVEEWSVAE
jgi:peptide/nickel transport system substrate-binding protein